MLQKARFHIFNVCRFYVGKRLCHNKPVRDPLFRRIYDSVLTNVLGRQENAFDSTLLRSCYKADQLEPQKWILIYHDFDASRIGFIGSLSFATVIIGLCVATADYLIHGEFTLNTAKVLKDDAEELGIFIIIPITLMIIVVGLLLKLHFMRIFRIYQNLQNSDAYAFVYPGFFQSNRMHMVSRSEIASKPLLYEDVTKVNVIQSGNISIKNRSMIINLEAFRAQPYRSYMLQERNELPDDFDSFTDSTASEVRRRKSSKLPPKIPPPPMF
uniref:Uncharacterized protein n=1 Tax=Panagrolaimus sp. JU765 TaxID=591449 RepID=A0AC34PU87_9BILA